MSPLPAATADAAAHENASQHDASRDNLSHGAQDALALDDRMRELIRGKYADEDAALERLQNLTEAERRQLKTDPTVLGDLREGVDPASVKSRNLAAGAGSYDYVTSQDRQQATAHLKSLDEQMNASLQQAPTLTHHLSI